MGEGPVWDWRGQLLYWVDIEGCALHEFNPTTAKNRHWHFDGMLGAAVPMESGELCLALETGLATFNLKTEIVTPRAVLENDHPKMRINDGKVGPNGNFWVGTMHKDFLPGAGNLYRVSKDLNASAAIANTTISNGMAWTSDQKKFYYIDSPTFEVKVFDYDTNAGTLSNGKCLIKIPEEYGSPDGMSIDSEDMLWIAHWGGHCIRRWNPGTGEVLEIIEVPAPHVTSCCFGGKDLKTMYITTARSGMSTRQLQEYPLSGGLFMYTGRVQGTPINYF